MCISQSFESILKNGVLSIPKDFRTDANKIIVTDKSVLDVSSVKALTLTVEQSAIILNRVGASGAYLEIPYTSSSSISNISVIIYDANGNSIKKYKTRDIRDFSANPFNPGTTDHRFKYLPIEHNSYPYSYSYSYTINYNGYFTFQPWGILTEFNTSILNSSYTINTSNDFDINYKNFNIDINPKITNNGSSKKYEWEINSIHAIDDIELFTPPMAYWKYIDFAPTKFKYHGFYGESNSWIEYGNWVYNLNQFNKPISPEVISKVNELTAHAKSDYEKVSILYKYLQDNTRYVNIALGIGGMRPAHINEVYQNGYGDCKGLSNTMKELLEIANIHSYYTIVLAGRKTPEIQEDFISQQFNHVILCVPLNNDSIWLECTSQTIPFGFLGDFTDNRKALLISQNNSHLVHTPKYNDSLNLLEKEVLVSILPDGTEKYQIQKSGKGLQYSWYKDVIESEGEKRMKFIKSQFKNEEIDISDFNIETKNMKIPEYHENITFKRSNNYSKLPSRIFFSPNQYDHFPKIKKQFQTRNYPIHVRRGYLEKKETIVHIPKGYKVESFPSTQFIFTPYGTYSIKFDSTDSEIKYTRELLIKSGTWSKESYKEFEKFYLLVYKLDQKQIVLVKDS
ncbi:DUF3857 domain-containing protein [bacterium SCSIO 12643]|nr:DUF3857 domain-containing protein [bacterium SCSIO 12643]